MIVVDLKSFSKFLIKNALVNLAQKLEILALTFRNWDDLNVVFMSDTVVEGGS